MGQYQKSLARNEAKEKSIKHEFSIEDARDTLDRIIGFIGNCDTKASVILGILGVILTIIITDSFLTNFYIVIQVAMTSGTTLSVFFLISLIVTLIVFLIGILFIVSSLVAKVSPSKKDSKIYFADIALNSNCNIYKKKVINQTEFDKIEDLIIQIHINSVICTRKYKRYNRGLVFVLIGFGLLMVLFVIGMLAYEIGGNTNGIL